MDAYSEAVILGSDSVTGEILSGIIDKKFGDLRLEKSKLIAIGSDTFNLH